MISLLKYLDLPWNVARGFLRQDLETLEQAINATVNTAGDTAPGSTVTFTPSGGSGTPSSGSALSPDALALLAAPYVAARVSLKV